MVADGSVTAGESSPPAVASAIKPKGIAVLGSHPETKMQAPFGDDWLIYACSTHNRPPHPPLPRFDVFFEVHKPITDITRPYSYLRGLEEIPVLYMRDRDAMQFFPQAVEYPEKEMKARFGPFVFTSSIAFMLAKAIIDCEQQGIKHLGVWGVMQASPNEFMYQRPAIQQLLWEAHKAKLNVMVPEESKLLEPPKETF